MTTKLKKFKNHQRPRREYRFDLVDDEKALKIWWDSTFNLVQGFVFFLSWHTGIWMNIKEIRFHPDEYPVVCRTGGLVMCRWRENSPFEVKDFCRLVDILFVIIIQYFSISFNMFVIRMEDTFWRHLRAFYRHGTSNIQCIYIYTKSRKQSLAGYYASCRYPHLLNSGQPSALAMMFLWPETAPREKDPR